MERSESITLLSKALCKAQCGIRPAIKDSENPHLKSKYADLASCWDACRDALAENGLAVVQIPLATERNEVQLETILMHESGEFVGGTLSIPVTKADAQGYGSALTYARRYALCALVGIAPGEDDGDAASKAAPRQNQRPATTPSAQPSGPAAVARTAPRITASQQKELAPIWRKANHPDANVKAWLLAKYKAASLADILVADFQSIKARLAQTAELDEPAAPAAAA